MQGREALGGSQSPELECSAQQEPGLCCHPGDDKWPQGLQGGMAALVLLKCARAQACWDSSESIPRFLMGLFVVLSKILLDF